MSNQQPDQSRRSLLKNIALGTAGAAVATVATTNVAHAADKPAQAKDGYRETPHIRAYYNSLRGFDK